MLRKLQIHRFRHVEPGTSLEFAEGFNVLLGKNGTGKTTLLELISIVLRSDFSSLKGEDFDIEYELANERGDGKVHFQNRRPGKPRVSILLTLHGEQRKPLEIEIDGPQMKWRAQGGEWEKVDGLVDMFSGHFLYFIRSRQAWDTRITFGMEEDVLFEGNIDEVFAYRFDESLQTFDRIIGSDPRLRPISLTVDFPREGDGWYGRGSQFVPLSYEPPKPDMGQSSVKVAVPPGSFLSRFPALAGFDAMTMSFAVEGSSLAGPDDHVEWRFGHAEFMFSRSGGSINHNALSYGQKRLLAFLYYLDANEKYVIADELVNGMHHDWIRASVDLISDRQSFLTSQNPLLLDYTPLESPEQVKRTFIRCAAKTDGDRTTFAWANLTDDEARELFADHQVGIQPVGELLRARGLW